MASIRSAASSGDSILIFPPPSYAGLSGESLSIMECQLVGRISRSSRGGIGSVWFADVRDGSSGEQASADEFGEADGRHLEMLLEPAEQQLDLPACLVEAADLDGRALEVVGEEGDLGSVVAPQANAAHRDGELGITFTDQLDLGIVEDGEAVAFVLNNGPPALGAKARALLHACHEAGAGRIDAGPPGRRRHASSAP